MVHRAVISLLMVLLGALPQPRVEAQSSHYCGQAGTGRSATLWTWNTSLETNDTVTIDYAVFFTPQAAQSEGGADAMRSRITRSFEGANLLFAQSGAAIVHRIALMQELPLDNVSTTLPELNTELAQGFDFHSAADAALADTTVVVVEAQIPGGFANIPLSPGRARNGGFINLGRRNVVAAVLAHEIGHTLGASHDYPEATSSSSDFIERFAFGNHFIGKSTGECYRTLMSALIDCRLPGFTNLPAKPCNCFSNAKVDFDGTPTGEVGKADAVSVFLEYAPFLASARGAIQLPTSTPTPAFPPAEAGTPTPVPESTITPSPGETPESGIGDAWHMISLSLSVGRVPGTLVVKGRCLNRIGAPLTGDTIGIFRQEGRVRRAKQLKVTKCTRRGEYKVTIEKKKGEYFTRHLKSKTDTARARF